MRSNINNNAGDFPMSMTCERRVRNAKFNVIGISAGYHDSACCLLQDGVLLAAVQEERFSRVKNDKAFPRKAFRYCLDEAGITIADIDCIAYYEDPHLKLGRQLWMGMLPDVSASRQMSVVERALARQPQEIIRKSFGYEGPVEVVEHHVSHAGEQLLLFRIRRSGNFNRGRGRRVGGHHIWMGRRFPH